MVVLDCEPVVLPSLQTLSYRQALPCQNLKKTKWLQGVRTEDPAGCADKWESFSIMSCSTIATKHLTAEYSMTTAGEGCLLVILQGKGWSNCLIVSWEVNRPLGNWKEQKLSFATASLHSSLSSIESLLTLFAGSFFLFEKLLIAFIYCFFARNGTYYYKLVSLY